MGLFSTHCGIGDSKGDPEHKVDELCKEHDDAYEKMIKQGLNPYFQNNKADDIFLDKLKKLGKSGTVRESVVKEVSKKFVEVKRMIFKRMEEHEVGAKGDVIPQSASKMTKGGKRFRDEDREEHKEVAIIPYNDEQDDYEMDDEEVTRMPKRARVANVGGGRRTIGQETPITIAPRIEYPGFNETETVRVGYTLEYICRLKSTHASRPFWSLRPTAMTQPLSGQETFKYVDASDGKLSYQAANGEQLPLGYISGTSKPVWGWQPYYRQLYKKYAILGCKYEIKFTTDNLENGNNFLGYMTLLGDPSEPYPDLTVPDMMDNKGYKIKRLVNNSGRTPKQNSVAVFSGYYRSGDYGEDVVSDVEAETWANFGDSPKPLETIRFGLAHATDKTFSGDSSDINIHIRMEQTIQFKGLYNKWRYLQNGNATFPNDYDLYGRYP